MIRMFGRMMALAALLAAPIGCRHDSAPAPAAGTAMEIPAVRAAGTVRIDGVIDPAEWMNAAKIENFKIKDVAGVPAATTAYVLYDDTAIYVAFHCAMPPGMKLKSAHWPRDTHQIYYDEAVELMLDPGLSRDRYMQFIVNAGGCVSDLLREQGGFLQNRRWNGEIEVKTRIGADSWDCEMKVPYYTLDIPSGSNRDWGIYLQRDFRDAAGDFRQSAGITPDGSQEVGKFPILRNLEVDFDRFSFDIMPPEIRLRRAGSGYDATVGAEVVNRSAATAQVKLECRTAATTVAGPTVELPPQTCKRLELELPTVKPGRLQATFTVVDADTRQRLRSGDWELDAVYRPLDIVWRAPQYRQTIFASQMLENVVYDVNCALPGNVRLRTGIKAADGRVLAEKTMDAPGRVSFPVAPLPTEKLTVFVEARQQGKLVEAFSQPLRKLAYRQGEVWRGNDGNWYCDGNKFFIRSGWLPASEHVPGLNVTTYDHPETRKLDCRFLFQKFIRQFAHTDQVTAAQEQEIRATVREAMTNRKLFAYYLADEPEIGVVKPAVLRRIADIIRDEDPWHPIMISGLGSKDFVGVSELNAMHAYPRVVLNRQRANFRKVKSYMRVAMDLAATVPDAPTITYMQQGFNYGDFSIPNCRVPSFDEIRSEFMLAQIMGARGVTVYNRHSRHYPEIGIGVPAFVQELKVYAPVLMEPEALTRFMTHDGGADFYWTVRKHKDWRWIFAVNAADESKKVTMKIPELAHGEVKVAGEERELSVENGEFTDTFAPYQVHVYTTDWRKLEFPPFAATEAKIKAVNAARRKKGNLAYQSVEGEKLDVTASSNKSVIGRPENCLWHVTDGVTEQKTEYDADKMIYASAPGAKAPHWIQLAFHEPVPMGRVDIYPLENSVKDYKIELWEPETATWRTVVNVTAAPGDELFSHRFTPVTAQKLRLTVTRAAQPTVRIAEIEVYEE